MTVVNNLDPVGPGCAGPAFAGSLRQCIAQANALGGSNTITFAPTVLAPIVLSQGELHITGSPAQTLTITGSGQSTTVVDGNNASRVFVVDSGAKVSMSGLTIRKGAFVNNGSNSPDGGAGIEDMGEVTLTDVTVADSQVTAGTNNVVGSGAIYVVNPAKLTLQRATITNNSVSGPNAAGGAIQICCSGAAFGVVTIANSTFSGNHSSTSGSLANGNWGGAIVNGGILTITGTSFTANVVTVARGATGSGGAILNRGSMTIDGSSFLQNRVESIDGSSSGGAIANCCGDAQAAHMQITNSLFDRNTVTGGTDNGGGAIANCCDAEAFLIADTLTGNSVTGDRSSGGGIQSIYTQRAVDITNSTITGNAAPGPLSSGGNVSVPACECTNNPLPLRLIADTIDGGVAVNGANLAVGSGRAMSAVSTIVAGSPTNNCSVQQVATLTDRGHNLDDGAPSTCGFTLAKSDVLGSNPKLGPLQNNGGPTPTRALLAGSPAIDKCDNAASLTTDQRGLPRFPAGDPTCDIGAFEVQPVVAAPSPTPTPTLTARPIGVPRTGGGDTPPDGTAWPPVLLAAALGGAGLVLLTAALLRPLRRQT
jgi:hypothetical protein